MLTHLFHKCSLLLSILFLTTFQQAFPQRQLSGTVTSQKGIPLAAASIQLLHHRTSTLSNQEGFFCFKNLPAGKDTLLVRATGYRQKHHIITFNETKDSLRVHLILTDTVTPLKSVTVHAGIARDNQSIYVAKMPLKNLDNPQIYNVVSHALIKEQMITNIDDIFKNVPGVVSQNTSGGYFSITSRGFSTNINACNGASISSYFTTYDPASVERIEVLKGPSGTLYQGAASFGGAVNLVTKKPHKEAAGSISYTTGSWGLNRLAIDLNRPLDSAGKFLFRLNTSADREKTFQNFGHSNIYTVSPSVSYAASEHWKLTGEFELYHSEKTPVPWQSFDDYYDNVKDIPVYKKAFAADDMKTRLTRQNGTFTSDYSISDNWQSTTIISALNTSVDHNYFAYNYFMSRDTFRRFIYDYDYNYSSTNIQQNFIGKLKLLGLKNKLVAGVEYVSTTFNYTGYGTNYDTTSIHDFQPMLRKTVEKVIEQRPTFAGASTWTRSRYAAYASDLLHLTDRLMTMLSLRVDRFAYKSSTPYKQTAFSPKLGIVYQPAKDILSLFANYNDGFSNRGNVTLADGTVQQLDPIHATQYEGGIKWEARYQKYAATLSIYKIKIHNANLYDKEGWFVSQDGIQTSRGLEFELKASPCDRLRIIAGYGYNENKYIKSSNYQGNMAANAPKNIVNTWINYNSPERNGHYFAAGAGANYVDIAYTDVYNRTKLPAYLLLNAVVGYHFGQTQIGIKLNNLSNRKYYTGSGTPMAPRSFAASVSFSF